MPTYECLSCHTKFKDAESLRRHAVKFLHPTGPSPSKPPKFTCSSCSKTFNSLRLGTHHAASCGGRRPLLMGAPPIRSWVCVECNFQTENQTESILHDELHAMAPPTRRQVETATAKLVKMEADLAAAEQRDTRLDASGQAPLPGQVGVDDG